ncbi:DUF4012 domain-containing protein [Candidatus Woesebacteria bacterium]|nr:DUF4012 domain-containing protein [Candidatus Woesebacteria bacterium]
MSALITQLLSDKPKLIIIGTSGELEQELSSELKRRSTSITFLQTSQVVSNPAVLHTDDLNDSYKIVWIIQSSHVSKREIEQISQRLVDYQRKLLLVILADTPLVSSTPKLPNLISWQTASERQLETIEQLLASLENTCCVVGQDIIELTSQESENTWRVLASDPIAFIDPQISLYPLDAHSFILAAVEQIMLPLPHPSVLIRGSRLLTSELAGDVKRSLAQIQARTIGVEQVVGTTAQLIPFSIVELSISPDRSVGEALAQQLARIVPSLPQPQQAQYPQPINPTVPQRATLSPTPPPSIPDAPPIPDEQPTAPQDRDLEITQQHTPHVADAETVVTEPLIVRPSPTHLRVQPSEEQKHIPAREKNSVEATVSRSVISRKRKGPQEKLDVSNELQKIFAAERVGETTERVKTLAKTEKKVAKKSKRKRVFFSGGLVAIALGLVVFGLAGTYMFSVSALKRSLERTFEETLRAQSGTSEQSFQAATPSAGLTKIVALQQRAYGNLFESQFTADAAQLVEIAQLIPQANADLEATEKAAEGLYSFVMGNETGEVDILSNKLTTSAQSAYEQLSKVQSLLKTVTLGTSEETVPGDGRPTTAQQLSTQYEQSLQKVRKSLAILQQLQVVLPDLLGEPTKRTYAVVLQNNQELRPTGGFIQSVALLTFAKGSLISSEVLSSYEVDKQVLGTVQPPQEIKDYLGEKQWFFRDSNWDPHFPTSAQRIAWFIEKSRSVEVDGVFALNLESLESLLSTIGPIELPEYNEVITEKNLQERLEFHSEVLLAPDTTQRDYTTVLLERIIAKLTSLPREKVVPTLGVIEIALEQQEFLMSFSDPTQQELIASFGWSGGIVRPNCPTQLQQTNCQVDFLYPVEANVGVNKANYYLERSVSHDITLSPEGAAHTHTLRIENTAGSNSWPKGTYKAYVRFFMPPQAQLDEIMLNGQSVAVSQAKQYDEQGLKVVGVLIDVPIQKQSEVTLSYTVPFSISSPFSYAFFLQKQPGVADTPVALRLSPPPGMRVVKVAPAAELTETVLEFSEKLDSHLFVGAQIQ